MENYSIPQKTRQEVSISDLRSGDVIYLSQKMDATPFSVLDVGSPFILIENMKTHFCNLYRPTVIYKEF